MFPIEQRYESLKRDIELACSADDERVGAALQKYCTVLICGFVERSVEIIILERLKSRAHPRVLKFVKAHFKSGTNYDCAAISELLERFDLEWRREFDKFVSRHEEEVEALRSTYSVRNSVAHGGTANVSAKLLKTRVVHIKSIVDAVLLATT